MSAASKKRDPPRSKPGETSEKERCHGRGKTGRPIFEKRFETSGAPFNLDNIRKEVNRLEWKAAIGWNQEYGHLSGKVFQKVLAEECAKAGLPVDTFAPHLPKDPVKKSPIIIKESPPFPTTSSSDVGWRSAWKDRWLEFAGPMYVSPRHTIEPPLESGEFRVTQQKFISLG
ncbi:uncharacterized protein LOC105696563 [Orussus abietinus]|uniref:uncharacterized protein LOC105696563 n=1 Tax=Orussus abietinus TaxID=222816 RepID=UPI0006269CA2|nr:uncharacterized protein LOC105696563 [Orussus abietinus]